MVLEKKVLKLKSGQLFLLIISVQLFLGKDCEVFHFKSACQIFVEILCLCGEDIYELKSWMKKGAFLLLCKSFRNHPSPIFQKMLCAKFCLNWLNGFGKGNEKVTERLKTMRTMTDREQMSIGLRFKACVTVIISLSTQKTYKYQGQAPSLLV